MKVSIPYIILFLGFYLVNAGGLNGQINDQWNLYIDGGRIPKHSPKIKINPWTRETYQTGISYHKRRIDSTRWRMLSRFPSFGLEMNYTCMAHSNVYGNAFSLLPSMQFYLFERKTFSCQIQLGLGLAFLTRSYREEPRNTAIGSKWNNVTTIRLLTSHGSGPLKLLAGAGITHFSNAALRQPNLGLNLLHFRAGIQYSLSRAIDKNKNTESTYPEVGWQWHTSVQLGIFDYEIVQYDYQNEIGNVYEFNLYSSYRTSIINRILGGVKVGYNDGRSKIQGSKKALVAACFLGHEVLLGKIGLFISLGLYLKQDYAPDSHIFSEFRLHYYTRKMGKGLFLGIGLKNHLKVAEYPSISVGLTL